MNQHGTITATKQIADEINVTKRLTDKLAVLVPSCDKYADLWKPFFALFWRFWPDCPFPVYLLSNSLVFPDRRVISLRIGPDISWSDNLTKAVGEITQDYILLFLEDLFLVDYVDTDEVARIVEWAVQSQVNYIRLNPSQKPDKAHNALTGVVSEGTIYRTSTVLSVWKKETLLRLLRPEESAWEFEIKGSVRSDAFGGFFSTWKQNFTVVNGVIKGKWLPSSTRVLMKLGVKIDIDRRRVMSGPEALLFKLGQCRTFALNLLPAAYRRRVKEMFSSNVF